MLLGKYCSMIFLATTTNERAFELKEVYNSLFNTPLIDLVSEDRFNGMKEFYSIHKKKSDLLPHQGLGPRAFVDINSYENLPETYADFISICSPFWKRDNFTMASY